MDDQQAAGAAAESEQQNRELLFRFSSSIVGLGWFDCSGERAKENGGQGKLFSVSCFVVSVQGVWFMITAGHILEDLKTAKEKGQLLTKFHIDDCWAKDSPRHPPAAFDFANAETSHYYDEESGADYAAIHLREFYKSRLESNKVKAWDESIWKNAPTEYDKYFIIGFPDQFITNHKVTTGVRQTKILAFFTLEKIDPPESLITPFPRFYGRICNRVQDTQGNTLESLDGMSGCPILGANVVKGGADFWIAAIQSKENTSHTIAIGCRFDLLGLHLEDLIANNPSWLPTRPAASQVIRGK